MGKLELVAVESGDIIAPGEELAAIADRIRDRLRRQVKDIVAIGADLIVVKAMLGHGTFGDWLKREFRLSVRSAQLYMTAAKWAEDKSEIISHLPLEALRLLSAPTTPAAIQEEVVEAIRAGTDVDFKHVGERIRDQRATILDARRKEERKQARLRGKSPEYQRKLERQMAREEAEREGRALDHELRVEEARSILRRLPSADLDRLREIVAAERWLSLKELVERLEPAPEAEVEVEVIEAERVEVAMPGRMLHVASVSDAEVVDDAPHPDAELKCRVEALIRSGATDAAGFATLAGVMNDSVERLMAGGTVPYNDRRGLLKAAAALEARP
jgi:hypothetical protein